MYRSNIFLRSATELVFLLVFKWRVAEIPFGDLITDKKDMELALRRAQAAILNPSIGSHKFLTMSAEQLRKGVQGSKPMLFSKNVVCVDLAGPELTDLAFIDLPGE